MTYTHPREHLADHLAHVRLLLQQHARRYADRLVDMSNEAYTDDCIGRSEVRRVLALGDDDGGQRWLDSLGYPQAPEIASRLRALTQQMSARLTDAGQGAAPLPLEELRASFQLSDLELKLLVAAAAPRLSIDLSRAFSFAWADFSVRQPTAGFLAELVASTPDEADEALRCLDPSRTLARYRLIVLHEHERWRPSTPLMHAPVAVPQRVLDFMRGVRGDEAALEGCALFDGGEALDSLMVEEDARAALITAMRANPARVCLLGQPGAGRRTLLRALGAASGHRLLEVDLCLALTPPESAPAHQRPQIIPRLAELLREARLHNALVLLRMDGIDGHPISDELRQRASAFRALISHYPGGLAASVTDRGPLISLLLGDIPTVSLRLGKQWSTRAIITRNGASSFAVKGDGSVLKTKDGGSFFTTTDIRPAEAEVEQLVDKTLAAPTKQTKDFENIEDQLRELEIVGSKILDRVVSGLRFSLKMEQSQQNDAGVTVLGLIEPNYHEWKITIDGKGLNAIRQAVEAVQSKEDWLYNEGLRFLQSLEDDHKGVKMTLDYERYPEEQEEVFRHGGKSQDVCKIIATYRKGSESLTVALVAKQRPGDQEDISYQITAKEQTGLIGRPVAEHYGDCTISHEPRDRELQTKKQQNENIRGTEQKTRPHDAISVFFWNKSINKISDSKNINGDPVIIVFKKMVEATFRDPNNKDRTSLATGDGRSIPKFEKAHGKHTAIQRYKLVTDKEKLSTWQSKKKEYNVTEQTQMGQDWVRVAGSDDNDKEQRILQALRIRAQLVLEQFRKEGIVEVNDMIKNDAQNNLNSYQKSLDPKEPTYRQISIQNLQELINSYSIQQPNISIQKIQDLLRYIEYSKELRERHDQQSINHQKKFEHKQKEILDPPPQPTNETEKCIQAIRDQVLEMSQEDIKNE